MAKSIRPKMGIVVAVKVEDVTGDKVTELVRLPSIDAWDHSPTGTIYLFAKKGQLALLAEEVSKLLKALE